MKTLDKISAILVDDEESARDVLENLLKRFCPQIYLKGKYKNIVEAVEAIKTIKPNLVFLDIQMPNYSGLEIVKFFEQIDFDIIFITAYDKYALRAFEVSATDYLLKPIDIERLKEAVQKVTSNLGLKQHVENLAMLRNTMESKELKKIVIVEKGYRQLIDLATLEAIEAQESYCYIYTADKKYTVSKNLKHFETLLEENEDFIRVHKSWIVNKNQIESYSKTELNIVLKNGVLAKLSKYKKADFEALIG